MKKQTTLLEKILTIIERGGNLLPHPATLFALMALAVVVLSGIAAQFDLAVTHPGTGGNHSAGQPFLP